MTKARHACTHRAFVVCGRAEACRGAGIPTKESSENMCARHVGRVQNGAHLVLPPQVTAQKAVTSTSNLPNLLRHSQTTGT